MRTITRLAAAIALAVLGVLGAAPAWAHDVVAPSRVVGGTPTTVTLAVVNEHDLPTDAVEVRLPAGFTYTSSERVPGWTSSLVRKSDGSVSAVRWTGGLLQSNETGEFVLRGTPAKTPGSLVWVVAQKSLGRGDYVAPPISFSPQMTVSAQALDAGSTAAPVPLATGRAAGPTGTVDGVARSRATLALVLAGLALVAVVFFEMTLVRRGQLAARAAGQQAPEDRPADAATAAPVAPATKSPKRKNQPRSGQPVVK